MAVEPGRSIVANAGVTLYTVGTIKEIPGIRTYVAVDGGMCDNIRTRSTTRTTRRSSPTRPTSLARWSRRWPASTARAATSWCATRRCSCAEVGDILCVCATGAYCQSMSSNYNKHVRPGVVFVRDGEWRWVVRRETYDDLMKCEIG